MQADIYLFQIAKILDDRNRSTLGKCNVFVGPGDILIADPDRSPTDPGFVCKLSTTDIRHGLSVASWNRVTNRINQLIEKGILCPNQQKSSSFSPASSATAS